MAITPLPALDRTSTTFRADVDAFFGTGLPVFSADLNALQTDVSAKQATASTAATTATTKAAEAVVSAATASTKASEASASAATATLQADLAVAAAGSITVQVSGPTHSATSKSTPADADEIPMVDSAASWTLKKLTWGNLKASIQPFPSGTRLPFAQAAAPTGWTQDTSDNANNRMLRVVSSGGNGVGGSHSPILNSVVPAHTHGFSTGNVSADHGHGIGDPAHNHGYTRVNGTAAKPGGGGTAPYVDTVSDVTSASYTGIWTGGASANHTHSGSTDNGSSQTNWAPRYIDLIICSKN